MSMRVQYTLPGLLPTEPVPSEATEGSDGPFLSRLKILPVSRGLSWKAVLQLDEDPFDPVSLDEPPRPAAPDIRGAALERWNWMQMLDRLGTGPSDEPTQRMLTLLKKFLDSEDFITARALAEAEE
jgi:hypothetical protein